MEITAKEIQRQASRLAEQTERCSNIYSSNINKLDKMSKIIKSEDSSLADTLTKFMNTYINVRAKIVQKFNALAATMENYVNETIANENQTAQEVETLNDSINDIEQSLSTSINDGWGGSER